MARVRRTVEEVLEHPGLARSTLAEDEAQRRSARQTLLERVQLPDTVDELEHSPELLFIQTGSSWFESSKAGLSWFGVASL